jgi:uncharacterized delta-60 repeat protein
MFSLTFLEQDYQGNYARKYIFPTQVSFPNTKYAWGADLAVDQKGGLIGAGSATRFAYDRFQEVFALCRFLPSGLKDKSFGKNGSVLYEVSKQGAELKAIAIDSQNNIIAVGYAKVDQYTKRIAIAKFNASTGKPITAFGNGGKVVCGKLGDTDTDTDYDNEIALDVAVDLANDDLYVVFSNFYLVRFLSSGQIDTTFNNGSPINYRPASPWTGEVSHIALDYGSGSLGGIVAGGSIMKELSNDHCLRLYLGRYFTTGEPDYSFAHEGECGVNGWKRYDQWDKIEMYALAIDAESGYIVAGSRFKDDKLGCFLMRCNTDEYGSDLDSGFGTGGEVFTTFPGAIGQKSYDMIIGSDGRIITAGIATLGENNRPVALAFYDKKGKPLKINGDKNGCLLIDYGTPFLKTIALNAIAEYGKGSIAILTNAECSKVGSKMYTPKDIFLTAFIVWVTAIAFISLP